MSHLPNEGYQSIADARLVRIIVGSLVLGIAMAIILVAANIVVEGRLTGAMWAVVAAIPVLTGLLVSAKRGHTRWTTGGLVLLLYLLMIATVLSRGTVRIPSISLVVLATAVSGMVLGRRSMILVLAGGILILGGLTLAEAGGLLHLKDPTPLFSYWLAISIFAAVTGAIVAYGGDIAQAALAEAGKEIAERRLAESSLKDSESRFRGLAEMSSDWYWEQDRELRLAFYSSGFAKNSGTTPDRMLGKCRWEEPSTSPLGGSWDEHRATLEAHQPFRDFEYRGIGDDGEQYFVSVSGDPVFDESGAFAGYRGVGTNITERKQREEDLLRFRLAIDAIADAIYVVDRASMRFLYANDAACTRLEMTREEIFAMGPAVLQSIPRAELERRYDLTIAAGVETDPVEIRRQRADGTKTWGELRRRARRFGDKWTIVTVVRDITERKRAEAALRAGEEQFRGLVEQSITGIYIIQDGKFVYVNPRLAEIFGYDTAEELVGGSAILVVAEKDRATVAEKMRQRLEGDAGSESYDFTALRRDGTTIEVGVHAAPATHHGRRAIIGLIQDISEKKRAEEKIQDYVAQLETAFMSTVEVATTLSELRDPYTAGHERRVGEIAVAIGAELGLEARRLEGLRVAGYLHDIGKITIPAEILSKPGKLSAIEFQLIKGHPQSGYDVLKDVQFPWSVADVALQHHERIDGSGYPQGLKGDEILLDARIMAVADVVEAMSSHRPYRPGLGIDKALAEIERGRGSAYDADVVDVCLRLFREKSYRLPV